MLQQSYPRPKGGVFIVSLLVLSTIMGGIGAYITLNFVDLPLRSSEGTTDSVTRNIDKFVLEESSAITDTVDKVGPAVVSIISTRNVLDFFGNTVEQSGGGTGFIITSDGLILTNKHVVSEEADYTVITQDGDNYPGTILALDPILDLAVVKIEATGLPAVDLGDSTDLKIGQWVVAIGNALAEFQNTVTVGVVSAKDRQIVAGGGFEPAERLEGLIQTDAAINPGNSGGPLVNLKGQVVGINTAVASDAQNIGFSIPINSAKVVIESVQKYGRIVRPMLGVRYVPITKELAELENLPVQRGALIASSSSNEPAIIAGSPAATVGLKDGDILIKINGEEITERNSLAQLLQQYQVNDEISVTYLRDGVETTVNVTLTELK